MSAARHCALAMRAHAAAIRRSLPSDPVPQAVREAMADACASLAGTQRDTETQLAQLRIYLDSGSATGVKTRVQRMVDSLAEEPQKLLAIATSLQSASDARPALRAAHKLMAGSALQLLGACALAAQAAERYLAADTLASPNRAAQAGQAPVASSS